MGRGDEFVILLPNTDIQEAEKILERVRKCISSNSLGNLKDITCSFGVAAYEERIQNNHCSAKWMTCFLQAKTSGKEQS